jgi:integrase/recombinase XerD
LRRQYELAGKSESTVVNYSRCLAQMALHFGCCPSELDKEQVLDYLQYLKNLHKTPSESYFKHTVYGLRALYKLYGLEDKHFVLPSIREPKKLPVVLSQSEVKRLISAPKLLKHRMLIALSYDCGLRRGELLNLEVKDIDFDRKMLHIRQGKGRKDRYVPVGDLTLRGLKTYLETENPTLYLFYRRTAQGEVVRYSASAVRFVLNQAKKHAGLQKHVTSHTLRHSYATHLLEMGLDIVSLRDALGHSSIETTMMYLHISRIGRQTTFSPLDRVYEYALNPKK